MPTPQPCPRCAKRLPSDARFCRRCGLALTPRTAAAAVVAVPPPPRRAGSSQAAVASSVQTWNRAAGKASRLGGLLGPAVASMAVCVTLGMAWFFCFVQGPDVRTPPAGGTSGSSVDTMPGDPSYTPPIVQHPTQGPVPNAPAWPSSTDWGASPASPASPAWPQPAPAVPQVSQPPRVVHPVSPHPTARPNFRPNGPSPYDPYGADGGGNGRPSSGRQNGRSNDPDGW